MLGLNLSLVPGAVGGALFFKARIIAILGVARTGGLSRCSLFGSCCFSCIPRLFSAFLFGRQGHGLLQLVYGDKTDYKRGWYEGPGQKGRVSVRFGSLDLLPSFLSFHGNHCG